jgi:hypothetical protein
MDVPEKTSSLAALGFAIAGTVAKYGLKDGDFTNSGWTNGRPWKSRK